MNDSMKGSLVGVKVIDFSNGMIKVYLFQCLIEERRVYH